MSTAAFPGLSGTADRPVAALPGCSRSPLLSHNWSFWLSQLGTATCQDVQGWRALKARGWRPLRDLDGLPALQERGLAAVPRKVIVISTKTAVRATPILNRYTKERRGALVYRWAFLVGQPYPNIPRHI